MKSSGLPGSVDLNQIISPVGQYIRGNPAPPLVRQIRPKTVKHFDEEVELESGSPQDAHGVNAAGTSGTTERKRLFAPLPMADYKSSEVMLEQQMPAGSEPKALPKAFGTANTVEAKVKFMLACS